MKPLIKKIFNGYNATVLAYGQTGSGKTFTMGTGDALTMDDGGDEASDDVGVIPRVIRDMFARLAELQHAWDVTVSCSFFELYNEEINDLFAKVRMPTRGMWNSWLEGGTHGKISPAFYRKSLPNKGRIT